MIVVILPTVCLLWFMTEAVKNERLAVRQKLIDVCNSNIGNFQAGINGTLVKHNSGTEAVLHLADLPDMAKWIDSIKNGAEGLVIYDAAGKQIYPFLPSDFVTGFSMEFQEIFELEQKGEYQQALDGYQKFFEENQDSDLLFESLMGRVRCLEKLAIKYKPGHDEWDFIWEILYRDDLKIRNKLSYFPYNYKFRFKNSRYTIKFNKAPRFHVFY